MSFRIDFSHFYYKCKNFEDLESKNVIFTYKSDLSAKSNFFQKFFDNLNNICRDEDFFNKLWENEKLKEKYKFHQVKNSKLKIIKLILNEFDEDADWVQQNINDSEFVFQIKLKDIDIKRRLFFILDNSNKIIKPLFIDLNHLIYQNPKFVTKFNICFVCNKGRKCK